MSTVLVLLEPQALHLTRAHAAGTPVVRSIALDTREPLAARELLPSALRAALRELPQEPEATAGNDVAVLLIDAALLEMAELSLPPVSERERRALFRRDADRHVPIEGPVAVTLGDGERPLVHACAAPWLAEWQQLLSSVLPVQAVLAMPVAMTVARGASASPSPSPSPATATTQTRTQAKDALASLAVSAYRWQSVPASAQLTDEQHEAHLHARAQRRRVQQLAVVIAALAMLLWLGNSWRDRTLRALEQQAAALARAAEPAESARARLARAQAELMWLEADARQTTRGASAVLTQVGERLPRDAFVQRAEWDGSAWRLDGTARDAAVRRPRLAADPLLRHVRSLAPSTRSLGHRQPRHPLPTA
ncbi:MAG: hypothetical protein IBJ19_12045, partial [Gemmatimonadaceae bacterium]|nr:hypothetical protein [Gemmatimonadaceae bacterium]